MIINRQNRFWKFRSCAGLKFDYKLWRPKGINIIVILGLVDCVRSSCLGQFQTDELSLVQRSCCIFLNHGFCPSYSSCHLILHLFLLYCTPCLHQVLCLLCDHHITDMIKLLFLDWAQLIAAGCIGIRNIQVYSFGQFALSVRNSAVRTNLTLVWMNLSLNCDTAYSYANMFISWSLILDATVLCTKHLYVQTVQTSQLSFVSGGI